MLLSPFDLVNRIRGEEFARRGRSPNIAIIREIRIVARKINTINITQSKEGRKEVYKSKKRATTNGSKGLYSIAL